MNILTHESEDLEAYAHLVEYQVKPPDLPQEFQNFRVRETFPMGNLLCGDLVINEESSKQLEVHPFPEWVVQLIRLDTKKTQVAGYIATLNMTPKELKKLVKLDWRSKTKEIKERVKNCSNDDIILFKLIPGLCVKIRGNVVHYAISEQKPDENAYPYCQVFEPAIDWNTLKPFGKFAPTGYFQLPFELKI
ncbi:MAG: hypothetical protein ACTSUE_08670 [Promethearchaeota archaeon]